MAKDQLNIKIKITSFQSFHQIYLLCLLSHKKSLNAQNRVIWRIWNTAYIYRFPVDYTSLDISLVLFSLRILFFKPWFEVHFALGGNSLLGFTFDMASGGSICTFDFTAWISGADYARFNINNGTFCVVSNRSGGQKRYNVLLNLLFQQQKSLWLLPLNADGLLMTANLVKMLKQIVFSTGFSVFNFFEFLRK